MDFAPEDLIGHTIADQFHVLRLIGQGGMGAVYEVLAKDGNQFALKLVLATDEERHKPRFLREGKHTMSVIHPNVVKLFQVGHDESLGVTFLLLELLRGNDLGETLRAEGALEPRLAARIVCDASSGIALAHELGIIHRDIKPSNIFLHKEDDRVVPKVCDFGIAKDLNAEAHGTESGEATKTGVLIGSPLYMSPEQMKDSKRVDPSSDVWSLSMCLYRALAGKHPWEALSMAEVLLNAMTKDVPSVHDFAPWVETGLAAIVHKGLSRDPSKRFQTVADFQRALEPFAAQGPLSEGPYAVSDATKATLEPRFDVPTGNDLPPKPTQQKLRVAAMGVGSALVLAIGAMVVHQLRPEGQDGSGTRDSCQNDQDCRSLGVAYVCRDTHCEKSRECQVNADCLKAHNDAPYICRKADGMCVALASEDCTPTNDPAIVANDSTIWFGTMFPLTGPSSTEFGIGSTEAVELARREFMKALGGLPSRNNPTSIRPIGLVSCDDERDPARAARHLTLDVGVPAVIGFGSSQEVIDLAMTLFIPNRVLSIASINSSALISSIPHPNGVPRLVFRPATTVTQAANALAAVMAAYVEPELRKPSQMRPAVAASENVRVALVRSENAAGLSFADALSTTLRVNGKLAIQRDSGYRDVPFADQTGPRNTDLDEKTVRDLLAIEPHALLASGQGDLFANVMGPLEARWPSKARHRPLLLFSAPLETNEAIDFLKQDPGRAARILAVGARTDFPENIEFTRRYNAAFGRNETPEVSPVFSYDSFYLLAYSAYLADVPSGIDLANGISRLVPPGKPIEVGPESIASAVQILERGESIDLSGGSSPLDFELRTGELVTDFDVFCVRLDDSGKSIKNVPSGLRYDSKARALVGSASCKIAKGPVP